MMVCPEAEPQKAVAAGGVIAIPGTICNNFARLWPDTARQLSITILGVLHYHGAVGDVDDEVGQDVGQQLLVDQLVDRPLPFVENFHENTETAGIGHITSIGYSHCCWFGSDIQFVEMTKLESCVNTNALNFVTTFFLSIVFCSSIVLFTPYSIIGFQLLIDRSFQFFCSLFSEMQSNNLSSELWLKSTVHESPIYLTL